MARNNKKGNKNRKPPNKDLPQVKNEKENKLGKDILILLTIIGALSILSYFTENKLIVMIIILSVIVVGLIYILTKHFKVISNFIKEYIAVIIIVALIVGFSIYVITKPSYLESYINDIYKTENLGDFKSIINEKHGKIKEKFSYSKEWGDKAQEGENLLKIMKLIAVRRCIFSMIEIKRKEDDKFVIDLKTINNYMDDCILECDRKLDLPLDEIVRNSNIYNTYNENVILIVTSILHKKLLISADIKMIQTMTLNILHELQ